MLLYVNYFYKDGKLPAHTKRSFQEYGLLTIHRTVVITTMHSYLINKIKCVHSLVPKSVRDSILYAKRWL